VKTAKSRLKALSKETHGKVQPMRRLYAFNRSSGGPRHGDERNVAVRKVRDGNVERVRGVRAARAAGLRPALDRRAEHEVVDEELRAPVEELRERLRPFVRL
jgi:hypothetical protein